MAFQTPKVTSLNFTQDSWTVKRSQIEGGKLGYFLQAPGDKRITHLAAGDKVLLTGRQIGPQATATVDIVWRTELGTHIALHDVATI